MREVVHVETQEEQDYVSMKLNNKIYGNRWNYIANDNNIFDECKDVIANGYKIISFNEFNSRYKPQLKIGDTFEHNGFVCRVESEVKKWYYNTRTDKYVRTKHYGRHLKEITDKEFIKQLEENAR